MQETICHAGAINSLADVLDRYAAKSIFLVVDKAAYGPCGAEAAVAPALATRQVHCFDDFCPNPRLEDARKGLEQFCDASPDCIVAIGGGTAIDMAKLISIFAAQPDMENVNDMLRGVGSIGPRQCPLIACPTTAGTGSEATHFAVVYVDKTKFSLADDSLCPDVAIVDPDLLKSAPPQLLASTGMDALCQGIESYWSIHATEESSSFAQEAIETSLEHLVAVVLENTPRAREGIARSAHLAGRAINLTKTTAPHAISYPITSYFGIPHGHAVALTLPAILEFNAGVTEDDCLDPRGAQYVQANLQRLYTLLGAKDAPEAAAAIEAVMDRIGLERRFSEIGLDSQESIECIITNGFNPQRVNNNPRRMTEESLRALLNQLSTR